ncbi:MAG: monovalent cation/H(+) antiporter subunit G [Verrucomicrobiota bacterium]
MISILASCLIILGALFTLVAGIGMVRMPDLYCRMHAATKAGAFGVGLILIAMVMIIPGPRTLIQGLLIVLFFYLTAPIAAHMIGRAGLLRKIELWRVQAEETEVTDSSNQAQSQLTERS